MVIAARAADLETDVARLQHDLISEITASEEARADASELRKDLGEKESLVESLEKELIALKKVKAEGAVKVRDLERKIGVLETKERNKRIRFEEEMRDRVDEKEKEINGFKQKLVELEKLEEALRESEEKVAALESSILQLREEAKEVERVILLLNEKAVETVENIDRGVNGIHDEGKGLKLQWPVVAAGSDVCACTYALLILWRWIHSISNEP
ncbi:uncharacterized protein HKW66_Vig0148080 [Vigna angularis]|uniref:Uncharacterized protein n=1 Tax=Phaseolus angularis TaxID=3914 RepID=A0A8T0JUW6_PHAAN|nr:uncharacterized protein HKW66_Vig0148080 [Vigna angularis]